MYLLMKEKNLVRIMKNRNKIILIQEIELLIQKNIMWIYQNF